MKENFNQKANNYNIKTEKKSKNILLMIQKTLMKQKKRKKLQEIKFQKQKYKSENISSNIKNNRNEKKF